MIIFIHEEAAERRWLAAHKDALVVERTVRGHKPHLVSHSADCRHLRHRRSHGPERWLICSTDPAELAAWCASHFAAEPTHCRHCRGETHPAAATEVGRLSRLARDVLDYVLDVAVIHMEPDAKPYALTIDDVARCLRKTSGQLAHALARLKKAELVEIEELSRQAESHVIRATAKGLRMLPYFADADAAHIESELRKLRRSDWDAPASEE